MQPLLTKRIECLNPSHKGKGDSALTGMSVAQSIVLILVIKERVIPLLRAHMSSQSTRLNPSHKGKGDSLVYSKFLLMGRCLNPSHKGKGDSILFEPVVVTPEVLILVIKERVIPG